MYHPSSQHISFREQIIALSQSYPCPRCNSGMLEPRTLGDTFRCSGCSRDFVALKSSRFLYPANCLKWKIAPTFWWDGYRWHWAGTTATTKQLLGISALSMLPIAGIDWAMYSNLLPGRPDWCTPALMSFLLALATVQIIYLLCWDFNAAPKTKLRH